MLHVSFHWVSYTTSIKLNHFEFDELMKFGGPQFRQDGELVFSVVSLSVNLTKKNKIPQELIYNKKKSQSEFLRMHEIWGLLFGFENRGMVF